LAPAASAAAAYRPYDMRRVKGGSR